MNDTIIKRILGFRIFQNDNNQIQTTQNNDLSNYNYTERQVAYHPIDYPQLTDRQFYQIAAMLASLLGDAVSEFEVIRIFGRVFVVKFRLQHANDPILPFVFRDYGRACKSKYRYIADKLAMYSTNFPFVEAEKAVNFIVNCVTGDDEITLEELDYLEETLRWVISMPVDSQNEENWI